MATATVGNSVLFAGLSTLSGLSDVVDLYDSTSGQWTTATLSSAHTALGVAVIGTQALFAGGVQGSPSVSVDTVDRYDGATGTWSTAALSSARHVASVAVVANQALFIGGWVQPDRVPVGPLVDAYTSDAPP